ncbi:hypothetical protein ACFL7D_10210 [candidate division KSB1 bacterium]
MIKYLLPYGWFGLLILLSGEVLLFSENLIISVWFTPVIWTGYILFLDSIVLKRTGTSFLKRTSSFLPLILILSIGTWLIFEGYNLLIKNWYYVNLPENIPVRYFGYAWAFATIFPGIFITYDFLYSFKWFKKFKIKPLILTQRTYHFIIIISTICSIYPLILPNEYLFPLIWISFIFLLDAVNYLLEGDSLFRDLEEGKPGRIYALFSAGLICGLLWEFWNYWAYSKWIYTVPYLPDLKIFEMPVLGYLGFPPFAVECFVFYQFYKIILRRVGMNLKY